MLNPTSLVKVLFCVCIICFASNVNADDLKTKVEKIISESSAEVVAVAFYDLENNHKLLINERVSLHAASTMKVPVMMQLFKLDATSKISLDSKIIVYNKFHSIVDDSEYSLTEADDSDSEVYKLIGQSVTIEYLIDRMITRSSNLATNILIELTNGKNVTRSMRKLGARGIQVRRGVEDTKAFNKGLNNTTTAYDLMVIMKSIAEYKFQNKEVCDQMIAILNDQKFNDKIPAGLPKGTKVAHKTGEITKYSHDMAIVYPPNRKPYILVIMTKGIEDKAKSSKLIADISAALFNTLPPK